MLKFSYFLLFISFLACGPPSKKQAKDLQSLVNEYSRLDSTNQTALDSCKAQMHRVIKDSTCGFKLEVGGVKYLVFVADLDSHTVSTHLYQPHSQTNYSNIATLKQHLQTPLMITNAGMFTPEHQPEGLYIEDGKKLFDLDTLNPNNGLNFYLQPNGVFYTTKNHTAHIVKTEDFKNDSSIVSATQSGPMLVIDGKLHPAFKKESTSLHIRSGVGIISNKKVVFACTIDKSNFYYFASTFKDIFGCKDALFLDGAISLMYIKGINDNTLSGDFGPMISITRK